MFFRKSLLAKQSSLKSISISDFAGGLNSIVDDAYISNNTAKVSYNINGERGVLTEGNGVQAFCIEKDGISLPVCADTGEKIQKLWYFKRFDEINSVNDDRIIFLSNQNKLYSVKINGGEGAVCIDYTPFNAVPQAINYRLKGKDVIIFCSLKDDMRVYDGQNPPTTVSSAPRVSSMCVHYDRLFATTLTDKNTLVFSDDLDLTNWDVGIDCAGYITMTDERGALLKVVSFLNYLFVFREYGISRLIAYGAQEGFSLTHLFLTTGKILGNTVCVCGETIIFLTEQGLFQFDGNSAKKILSNLDGYFEGCDNANATATYCNGKYYLSANVNFFDGKRTSAEKNGCINNAVLEIDLFDGSTNLMRGFDVISLVGINGDGVNGLFMCFGEKQPYSKYVGKLYKGGKLFDTNTLKAWTCPDSDLNKVVGKKQLLYITLLSKHDVTLVFDVDGKEYFFEVKGMQRGQKVPLNLVGESFGMQIVCKTENMFVSRPQLVFKEYA